MQEKVAKRQTARQAQYVSLLNAYQLTSPDGR